VTDHAALHKQIVETTDRMYADDKALGEYLLDHGPLEINDHRHAYGREMGARPVGSHKADIMRLVARNVLGERWGWRVEEAFGGEPVLMIGRRLG
jgi:hypothetical protein